MVSDSKPDQQDSVFFQDRKEREYYFHLKSTHNVDHEVLSPLTRDGFEALLEVCCAEHDLPVNDSMRSCLVAALHGIPRGSNTTTLNAMAKTLYQAFSNANTWQIDQEIKEARRMQQIKDRELAQLKVVENDKEEPGTDGQSQP
jgi:hypothetical protein